MSTNLALFANATFSRSAPKVVPGVVLVHDEYHRSRNAQHPECLYRRLRRMGHAWKSPPNSSPHIWIAPRSTIRCTDLPRGSKNPPASSCFRPSRLVWWVTALLQHGIAAVPKQAEVIALLHPESAVQLYPTPPAYLWPMKPSCSSDHSRVANSFSLTGRLPVGGEAISAELSKGLAPEAPRACWLSIRFRASRAGQPDSAL